MIAHAFSGGIGKGEERNEVEMLEQVKRLLEEAAAETLA